MCSPSTTSTFSMVTNGNLNTPSFVPPLGRAVGVLDIQQVDISDLLHEPVGVGVLQADFVDTLELSRSGVAIGPQRSAANILRQPFERVTLDNQAGIGVHHVEVADVVAILFNAVLKGAAGPVLLRNVEFEDAKVFAPLFIRLPFFLRLDPERPFEQRVKKIAVL